LFCSCLSPEDKPVDFRNQYYSNNEDQFTFIILDKAECDSFIEKYQPLNNPALIKTIQGALSSLQFEAGADSSIPKSFTNYDNNTRKPDSNSFSLAMNIIRSLDKSKNAGNFGAGFEYLFYYKCLPAEIRYKWHQTSLGNFEFNTTFFNRLRLCNKEFDELCYGERSNQDAKLSPVFGEYITNEISQSDAASLKKTIETNTAFGDKRLANDKAIFMTMLDKVIDNKWRLIMIDWN
jgi:hypothetical protein